MKQLTGMLLFLFTPRIHIIKNPPVCFAFPELLEPKRSDQFR